MMRSVMKSETMNTWNLISAWYWGFEIMPIWNLNDEDGNNTHLEPTASCFLALTQKNKLD